MIDTFAADIARFAAHRAAEQDAEDVAADLGDEPDDHDPIRESQERAAEQAVRESIERRWAGVRLTERGIAEMDQERRDFLRWWITGGAPSVAEVDANGRELTPAELRERFEATREATTQPA